jgi:putative hydrolase of the HAD superfamily
VIKAVLFDLDETLLDRTTSLIAFLKDQYARFRSDLGDAPQAQWVARFVELDRRGSVNKRLVYPELLEDFSGVKYAASALFQDYNLNCCLHAQPFDRMHDVLAALRSRGMRIAIVTNGETIFQTRHIKALRLTDFVDEVLISEAEGLRKPDARLFARAAERLGVTPQDCLMVGDNPSADILGAHDAGMRTAWFRCGQTWPAELRPNPGPTIESLAELRELAGLAIALAGKESGD